MIDKNIFRSLASEIYKKGSRNVQDDGNIEYTLNDLALQTSKNSEGKVVPQELSFYAINDTYYLRKDGTIYRYSFDEYVPEIDDEEDEDVFEEILENSDITISEVEDVPELEELLRKTLELRLEVLNVLGQ